MERVALSNISNMKTSLPERLHFVIDGSKNSYDIPDNVLGDILVSELPSDKELTINVNKGCDLIISFLCVGSIEDKQININIKENSVIEAYFADFSMQKAHLLMVANLLERGASIHWHLSSLAAGEDNKHFDISVNHIAPGTFARMDNYGVCKDAAKLVFSGVSTINNGSKGSKTHQNSKIMVFDSLSDGIAKPILKIDENDIEASHAAVVGKINDEHLFYLTSRGLSESEAKELITFGYLKPILNGFIEEEIKEKIISLIEGRM